MDAPVFPQEFIDQKCWKVSEARSWRRGFNLHPDPEEDRMYAECEFRAAGCGMECTNCGLFLQGIHMNDDEKTYLPLIRKFYKDSEIYWKEQETERQEKERASMNLGAGI